MPEQVIRSEVTSTLVIECPARCVDRGCTDDHGTDGWRESKALPAGTSIDYGRILMERHAEEFPKSGPYRLVYRSTTTTETMEVIQ